MEDSTQLLTTFKATNLVNIVSMLYGMLHKDASTPVKYDQTNMSTSNAKKQPTTTLELTTLSVKLLNQMIILDLNMVQVSLCKYYSFEHLFLIVLFFSSVYWARIVYRCN